MPSNFLKTLLIVLAVMLAAIQVPESTVYFGAKIVAQGPGRVAVDSDPMAALEAMYGQQQGQQSGSDRITVHNPKSNPVVGGTWEVALLLDGRGELLVHGVAPTMLARPDQESAEGVDVSLVRIQVEGQSVTPHWNGDGFSTRTLTGSLQVNVTLRVHTLGRHRVGFTYGSAVAFADNSALPTFTPIASATTGLNTSTADSMVFADFNTDGYPDMLKTGSGGGALVLSLNDQDGTFTTSTLVGSNMEYGLSYGDWNHDGEMDFVTTQGPGNNNIYLGTNDGSAASFTFTNPATNQQARPAIFMDVDSDGDLDILAPRSVSTWFTSNLAGTWTAQTGFPGDASETSSGDGCTVTDINNDGRPDIVWNRTGSVCRVYYANGANNFSTDTNVNTGAPITGLPQDVGPVDNMEWAWADYDNDGDVDVFISGSQGVGFYRNGGTGAFTNVSAATGVTITATTTGACWGDYDNDGDLDLLVTKGTSTILYKNSGSPSYTFTNVTLAAGIKDLTGPAGFCDFDLDGDLDIMTASGQYMRNDLTGTAVDDYLKVQAIGAGGTGWSPRVPFGARVQLWDKTETTLLQTQWVSFTQNNYQPWNIVQFGCDSREEYVVRVRFPSTLIEIEVTGVVPSLVGTRIGGNTVTQAIAVYENAQPSYEAISGNPWGTLIMYGENTGTSILRQRTYDSIGNVMGPEATALQLSRELRWIVRPTQNLDLDIVTVLTEHDNGANQTYYRAFRFNGQIWQSDWVVGPFPSRLSQIRSVDMATEATSGDILVVYADGTDDPKYRTYASGVWSAASDVFATDPGNTVEWVQLRAKPQTTGDPTTNEIWLFYSDTDENVWACRWNGTTWDEATTEQQMTVGDILKRNALTSNAELQAFDAAYETLNGEILFAYGPNATNTGIRWRTLTSGGTTFGATSNQSVHNAEGSNTNRRSNTLKLSPDPLTNRIAMVSMTTSGAGRTGAGMWTGSAWTNTDVLAQTNLGLNDGARARHLDMFDMAWMPALQQVICTYADDGNDNDIDWASWNRSPGGTANNWDDEPDVGAAGFSEPRSILSWPNRDETRVVSLVSNDNSDLFLIRWDGTTWTIANGGVALETTIATITNGTPFTLYAPGNREGTPGLWTGAVDSDWNNPANWDDWKVPSGIAVTINTGATNYPVISGAGGSVTSITVAAGATLDLTTAGSLTVTGTVSLSGTFQVDAGATLTMGNGSSIAVASGGSFLGRGSDSSTPAGAVTATVGSAATDSWTITVATGGTVDLKGTAITAGRIIPQDNVVLRLSDVSFSTLPTATTNFIDLSLVQSGTINMRNLSFTRGSNVTAANARNILTASTTYPLTIHGYSGDMAGESFDGDTTNRIHWQHNCLNLTMSGTSFYTYEREIRIDHTKVGRGGLSNFPVYVTLTDADMVAKAQADGDDFRFLSATGTQLDHEIETWNTATGQLAAWVRIPSLSDKVDTLIYLQYGNATTASQQDSAGVWDADHVLVWHLDDASTGTADDSTTNNRDGTASQITATTGVFGGAANWATASTSRYVQISVTGFHPTTVATHEAWFRTTATGTRNLFSYATAGDANTFRLDDQDDLTAYIDGTSGGGSGLEVDDGNWHHVAMTWDSADGIARIYLNGVAQDASTINMGFTMSATGGLVLGQDQDSVLGGFSTGDAWVGDIDEFRLSGVARSEAWLQTTYNNGSNPATFAVVGVEENRAPNLVDIYDNLPGVGETLNVTSRQTDDDGNVWVNHADHRGILQLAAFAGTINIDGIRFSPSGTASGISVAAGATGTVNFYNCAFTDPGNGMTTTAAGAGRAVVSKSGSTALNAFFCTVDSAQATGTNGFSAASTATNVFTGNLSTGAAGQRATHVVDFNNRNLRPTETMRADAGFSAARDGTYTSDLDGRTRSATTLKGAWESWANTATTVANSDITNGAGGGTIASRIIFNSVPANNSGGNAIYMSGSDGTTCYVAVLSRTTMSVVYTASWAGSSIGFCSFVQCSDAPTHYWLYVPYDSNGDFSFDRVRRLKHIANTSLTSSGDQVMLDRLGAAIDFTSNGGWRGQVSVQNSTTTGVLSGEQQVSLATPGGFGSVHAWYVNTASASGLWYPLANLTGTNGWAADSYSGSGAYNGNPNPYAQPLVYGSPASGSIMYTRMAHATGNESILLLQRNLTGTGVILNSYTGPTTAGESITGVPFALFNANDRRSVQRTDNNQTLLLQWPNLTTESLTLSGISGYTGVWGVPPVAFDSMRVKFIPYKDADGCFGAVAAVEYRPADNGGAAYELLDSAYSNPIVRYNVPATPGSFVDGIAPVLGTPTRLAYAPTPATNTVIFCATDAGLLYCWEAHGSPTTSHASPKGKLISGYPVRVEGGRITACNFVSISDTTLRAKLGLGAGTSNLLACFTDRGQVILVRTPTVP